MIKVELNQISKRYRFEWILKKLDYCFEPNQSYAVLGHNGSGKSTLMQILSGYLSPSSGKIIFSLNDNLIDINNLYRYISFSAPYTELIEELTLEESIQFHSKFKPLLNGMKINTLLDLLNLPKSAKNKAVQYFSSGMKQRLKLSLSVLSDAPLLLLDEPTITLDKEGIEWYRELMQEYAMEKKTVIIASNIEEDVKGCNHQLNILDYKV